MADHCYKLTLKKGHTLFIPTGWIHAVLTPVDALVYGGNFLHKLNIQLQLKCYELECHLNMPNKFRHPSYETLNWYAAQHFLDDLKGINDCGETAPAYLLDGLEAMAKTLQGWCKAGNGDPLQHKAQIPDSISPSQLMKELFRQLKHARKWQERAHTSPLKITIPKSRTCGQKGCLTDAQHRGRKRESPFKAGMTLRLTNGKVIKQRVKHEQGVWTKQQSMVTNIAYGGTPSNDLSKADSLYHASASQRGQMVRIRRSSDDEHSSMNVDDIGFGLLTSGNMTKTQTKGPMMHRRTVSSSQPSVEMTGGKRSLYTVKDKDFVYLNDDSDTDQGSVVPKQSRLSSDKSWNPKTKQNEPSHMKPQPAHDPTYNPVPSVKQRRQKKGPTTAKQRLGRILKLDRPGRRL
jgi:hypothetical protein